MDPDKQALRLTKAQFTEWHFGRWPDASPPERAIFVLKIETEEADAPSWPTIAITASVPLREGATIPEVERAALSRVLDTLRFAATLSADDLAAALTSGSALSATKR